MTLTLTITQHQRCLPLARPASQLWLPPAPCSHEEYLDRVKAYAIARLHDDFPQHAAVLRRSKLTYGGLHAARGMTLAGAWHNPFDKTGSTHDYINICATGEENALQLIGTCLHELGHVLAGCAHGHDMTWKQACKSLGLMGAQATGHVYNMVTFDAECQEFIITLPTPSDGTPRMKGRGEEPAKVRPCSVGVGTRGGASRGTGSGSRMRKIGCPAGCFVGRTTAKYLDSLPVCQCGLQIIEC